jgi:nucleoside-diphosphate-sugar epimerase
LCQVDSNKRSRRADLDIQGKRVLVIVGGAGLIDSHVVEELLKEDVKEVIVYDNFCRGVHENLGQALADHERPSYSLGNLPLLRQRGYHLAWSRRKDM